MSDIKTDRELLELAARAVGIEIVEWSCIEESCDAIARLEDMRLHKWNPLTDDGDALRLAVKLNMDMLITDEWTKIKTSGRHWVQYEGAGLSSIEITRRAIVRAAAAIGETL